MEYLVIRDWIAKRRVLDSECLVFFTAMMAAMMCIAEFLKCPAPCRGMKATICAIEDPSIRSLSFR